MLETLTKYVLLIARPLAVAAEAVSAHPYAALALWACTLAFALWA